ncbi:MAG: hypothetical protein ABUS49_06440, partial [Acidobacteriota bacterium]
MASLAALAPAAVNTAGDSPKELAMALAKKARRAEKADEPAQAYLYYAEASALQPRNRRYKGKMASLQTRAARQSKPQPRPETGAPEGTDPDLLPSPGLGPDDVFDSMTAREMAQARELKALPRLQAKEGKQDFDLTADARGLFDQVAARFGLQPVYDGDYPTGGARIAFKVDGVNYREAFD